MINDYLKLIIPLFPKLKTTLDKILITYYKIKCVWMGSSGVEQWTFNPLVVGSNPTPSTINKVFPIWELFFFEKKSAILIDRL